MPRNEDGEFELVVGNKQLLSIVFILIVVFGVVFSMGFFVGRANTEPSPPLSQQAANQQAKPQAAGSESPTPIPDVTPDASLTPGDAAVTTPDTATHTEPVSSVTPEPAATPTPAPVATPKPPVKPPPTPKPVVSAAPAAGHYLQVAAVKKPQAEALVAVLKEKGFHALAAPIAPGGEMYRALVGPLGDAAEIARTKADLEKAGFKSIPKTF